VIIVLLACSVAGERLHLVKSARSVWPLLCSEEEVEGGPEWVDLGPFDGLPFDASASAPGVEESGGAAFVEALEVAGEVDDLGECEEHAVDLVAHAVASSGYVVAGAAHGAGDEGLAGFGVEGDVAALVSAASGVEDDGWPVGDAVDEGGDSAEFEEGVGGVVPGEEFVGVGVEPERDGVEGGAGPGLGVVEAGGEVVQGLADAVGDFGCSGVVWEWVSVGAPVSGAGCEAALAADGDVEVVDAGWEFGDVAEQLVGVFVAESVLVGGLVAGGEAADPGGHGSPWVISGSCSV